MGKRNFGPICNRRSDNGVHFDIDFDINAINRPISKRKSWWRQNILPNTRDPSIPHLFFYRLWRCHLNTGGPRAKASDVGQAGGGDSRALGGGTHLCGCRAVTPAWRGPAGAPPPGPWWCIPGAGRRSSGGGGCRLTWCLAASENLLGGWRRRNMTHDEWIRFQGGKGDSAYFCLFILGHFLFIQHFFLFVSCFMLMSTERCLYGGVNSTSEHG